MNFSTPILNTSALAVVGNEATKILGFDLDKLWWELCSGLMKIIDWLTLTFDFLTGAEVIDPSGNGGTGGNVNDLLSSVFKGVGDGVSMIFKLGLSRVPLLRHLALTVNHSK